MKILLGSNSPRRKELLQNLGFNFVVVAIDCNEVYPEDLEIEKIAAYLSELKASAFANLEKGDVLITADTIVALENEILGKPKNKTEAKEMLRKLSGKTHQVYTAFTIKNLSKTITETDVAAVEVEESSEAEIDQYIAT